MSKLPKKTMRDDTTPASAVRVHSLRQAFLECEHESISLVRETLQRRVCRLRYECDGYSKLRGATPGARLEIRDALYKAQCELNAFERAYVLLFNEDPAAIAINPA